MRKIIPDARLLLIVYVPAALVLLAAAAVSLIFHVSVSVMTADPTATARVHPLTGVVSSLGVILWCASASVCAFAASSLPRGGARRFLAASAGLSAYLLLDDLFLFHENLAPRHLALSEDAVFAALGAAVCAYLVSFRRIIARTDYALLLAAVGLLAASAAIDDVFEPWLRWLGHWEYFLEDGAKWLGIASWCGYYASVSRLLLQEERRAFRAPPAAAPRPRELAVLSSIY